MKKLLFIICTIVLLVGCSASAKFERSDDDIELDFIGQTINIIKVSEENLKDFKIIDRIVSKDTAQILAEIAIEHNSPSSGSLNKDLKKNDVIHSMRGQVTLEYKRFDKEWHFSSITNYNEISYKKTEKENLMERIPFNKNEEMIIQDLKDKNTGISVVSDHIHTISFGSNEVLGYKPITKINKFELISTDNGVNDLVTNVILDTDLDYNVENSIYKDNGNYNVKGNLMLVYKLTINELGKEYWELQTAKPLEIKE